MISTSLRSAPHVWCTMALSGVLVMALLIAWPASVLAGEAACNDKAETRRLYVDARFGQLHVHHASPTDEVRAPPLVLLHQTPLSGRMYSEIIGCLAQGRHVYALDTPGYGESDPPPAPTDIETYAAAVGDFLATLEEPVDLLGYHTGVLLAVELAVTQPARVRALVLVAVPLLSEAQRSDYRPTPSVFEADGSHLLEMWQSSWRARPEGQSIEQVARIVAEKQRAGARAWWAGPAINAYELAAKLPQVMQPTLLIRPGDGLWTPTGEAAKLLPHATLVDREDWKYGFFDAAPATFAALALDWLDEVRQAR